MDTHMKGAATKDMNQRFNDVGAKRESLSCPRISAKIETKPFLRYRENAQRDVSFKRWKRRLEFIGCIATVITAGIVLVPGVHAWKSETAILFGLDVGKSCPIFEGIDANTSDEQIRKHIDESLSYIYRYIDANSEQQEVLSPLLNKAIHDIMDLYRKGQSLQQRFLQTLLDERVDHQNLRRILREVASHNERTNDYIAQLMTALSGGLTQEQRTKIFDCVTSKPLSANW